MSQLSLQLFEARRHLFHALRGATRDQQRNDRQDERDHCERNGEENSEKSDEVSQACLFPPAGESEVNGKCNTDARLSDKRGTERHFLPEEFPASAYKLCRVRGACWSRRKRAGRRSSSSARDLVG